MIGSNLKAMIEEYIVIAEEHVKTIEKEVSETLKQVGKTKSHEDYKNVLMKYGTILEHYNKLCSLREYY